MSKMSKIGKNGKIILKVVGGFGNQLFMLANAISLSIDYKLNLIVDTNLYDPNRFPFLTYKLFQSKNINKENIKEFSKLSVIKQGGFKYKKINLDSKRNYLLNEGSSGYFQSWKFFSHNIENIKNYFNIDWIQINYFQSILKSIGKHIGIHIRLTDYIKKSDFHKIVDVDNYKNILSQYNLSEYKIILFSDDVDSAQIMLETFINPSNILLARNYIQDDEAELFFLACTDIRICPNSSYSLWSCYLNEMYQFNLNSNLSYYFPSKWFGPGGIKDYNIWDLIPQDNPKYKVVNV